MDYPKKFLNINSINEDIEEFKIPLTNKAIITNFPDSNIPISPLNKSEQSFVISVNGLKPYIPSNSKIKLFIRNSTSDLEKVATIEIDQTTNNFLVNSNDININIGNPEYFNFTNLSPLGNIENNISINNSDNTDILEKNLNNKSFSQENIISLRYFDKTLIQVENIKFNLSYMLKDSKDFFKIDHGQLTPYTPNKLSNIITFKNENNEQMGTISFNIDINMLTVTFTNEVASSEFPSDDYFIVKLKSNTKIEKFKGIVRGSNSFNTIAIALDNKIFQYGDILELAYKETNKVLIDNLNGITTFTPPKNLSSYIITRNGLEFLPNIMKNKIIFKGENSEEVATISFDNDDNVLIVTSSGAIADESIGDSMAFHVELIDSITTISKVSSSINGNENANNFKLALNNESFEVGDTILLKYKKKARVSILNYPNDDDIYTLTKDEGESFRITRDELISYTPIPPPPVFLDNVISFRSANNESDAATIKFNIASMRLNATSDGNTIQSTDKFHFILKANKGSKIVENSINSSENGIIFSNNLNGSSFKFNDIIEIRSLDKSRALISNLPIVPNIYFLPLNEQNFIITPSGLNFSSSSPLANAQVLPHILTIRGNTGNAIDILATVYLDNSSNTLIVYSTGKVITSPLINDEFFALILEDDSGMELKTGIINTNENADNFAQELNGVSFLDNYFISLRINENA